MAISKERLELLIKDGGTIFYLSGKTIEKKVLKHKYHEFFINEGSQELVEYNKIHGIGLWAHKLSKLFETEEDAKWHKEFKRIPRTDYLDLPTWEEFRVIGSFAFYDYKHNLISMKICLDPVNVAPCNDCIYIADSKNEYFCKPKTKENYTKACRKARELFLGE